MEVTIEPLHKRLRAEQIRLIYRQGPVMVLGATLIAVILCGFLWPVLAHRELGYWFLMICLSACLRSLVFLTFRRSADDSPDEPVWGVLFWVTSIFAGAIWGLFPVLFSNDLSTETLLLISTVFAGMVAVTASAGNIFPASFYAFALPLVLPLIVVELMSGKEILVVTGIMLLLYLIINILLVRRGHQQFEELVSARYENANLMDQLSIEKEIAERAVEVKNRFMAAASHDLRQPLHALGMFVGSLRKRDRNPDRLEIIDDMESATNSLGELLHGLLDMSKLEADVVLPQKVPVVLADVLHNLEVEFSQQAADKQLKLSMASSNVFLLTDSLMFERILRNLLSNAITYTVTGSIDVVVKNRHHNEVDIIVIDTGIGVPTAEIEKIFNEYYQLEDPAYNQTLPYQSRPSSLRVGGRLGLGLSIVKRLCELLDIKLALEAGRNGVGTAITLTVETSLEAPVEEALLAGDVSELAGKLVLLIDDEPMVLHAASRWLSDCGAKVQSAESYHEALMLVSALEQLPDFILCDYRLPGSETGLDLVAALRHKCRSQIPAAIVSADTSPEVLARVAESGLTLFHKPVTEDALINIVRKLLRNL